MASPLRRPHGIYHFRLSHVLATYEDGTPGIEAADNATVMLGEESEPQPDLMLRILTEHGGRSGVTEGRVLPGASRTACGGRPQFARHRHEPEAHGL